MTNHFPSFEENCQPEDPRERYVNLTNQEGWQHFLEVADKINQQLINFDDSVQDSDDILNTYDDYLVEVFGSDYDEQKAKVLGFADVVDRHDVPTGDQHMLTDLDEVTFNGVVIYPINNKWQVRLAFSPKRQDHPKAPVDFYVSADKYHIADLAIIAKTEDEMNELIYSDALTTFVEKSHAAARFTSSDAFLSLPTSTQHAQLNMQSEKMSDEFVPCYADSEVDIVCSQYYAIPDDMADIGFPIEMFYTNQMELDEKNQFIPSGKIMSCKYLEQGDYSQHFDKPADFKLGFGAPCLFVYNKARQCSYYIVSQSIGDIDITDYVEYDD
jgi:hypothetical protein